VDTVIEDVLYKAKDIYHIDEPEREGKGDWSDTESIATEAKDDIRRESSCELDGQLHRSAGCELNLKAVLASLQMAIDE
jgi:hypothetical protein